MSRESILIVEDEPKILEFTASYVRNAGYETYTAVSGEEALSVFRQHPIDLILLDLMLPDISGEVLCQQIRSDSDIPIIMITAKTDEDSIIAGLQMGADDYVCKPFSPRQLVARIQAILRRAVNINDHSTINHNLIRIDRDSYSAHIGQVNIALTKTEFMILSTLASRPTKVFTRDELVNHIFDASYEGYPRNLDSHIKNIRNKIAKYTDHDYILTVRGIGYRFHEKEDQPNEV